MKSFRIPSRLWIMVLIALLGSTLHALQETLDFPAPQLMLPMYDHFSLNPANTAAMGRGQTAVAAVGNIANAVNNPATLSFEQSQFYMEMCIKPAINELDMTGNQSYNSPYPFGLIGMSAKLRSNIYGGLSYSMPKSILQDDFHIVMNQGAYWFVRYPSYNLHQFTATANVDLGKFNLGLNVLQQLHHFQDIAVLKSFENMDFIFNATRFQPGVLYQTGGLTAGLTYLPQTNIDMDIRYADYQVTLPSKTNAGITFKQGSKAYYAEAELEQCSQMSSSFDDRFTFKAGYETRVRNTTYRAGFVIMPGVFTGSYLLPMNSTEHADTSLVWIDVPVGGDIDQTDQFLATGGFTYHFKGGELSLALMQDFGGNVNTTRFMTSLGFETNTLKKKKFLIFD